MTRKSNPSMEERDGQWEPVPGRWRQLTVYSQHWISEGSVVVQFCSDTWGYIIVMKTSTKQRQKTTKKGKDKTKKTQLSRRCHVQTLPRLTSAASLSQCQFGFPRQKPQPFISITMKTHFQATLLRVPHCGCLDNHLPCKWLLLLWTVSFIPLSCWKAFSESSPLEQEKKNNSEYGHVAESMVPFDLQAQYYKFEKQQGFALLSKAC